MIYKDADGEAQLPWEALSGPVIWDWPRALHGHPRLPQDPAASQHHWGHGLPRPCTIFWGEWKFLWFYKEWPSDLFPPLAASLGGEGGRVAPKWGWLREKVASSSPRAFDSLVNIPWLWAGSGLGWSQGTAP